MRVLQLSTYGEQRVRESRCRPGTRSAEATSAATSVAGVAAQTDAGQLIGVHVGPGLTEQVGAIALAAPREQARLVPAGLGADSTLLGAAELAFEPFLADPLARSRARA